MYKCRFCSAKGSREQLKQHRCSRGRPTQRYRTEDEFLASIVFSEDLGSSEGSFSSGDIGLSGGGGDFGGGGASSDFDSDSGSSSGGSDDSCGSSGSSSD